MNIPCEAHVSDRGRLSINGRFLTQPVTGVQRYAREMLSALDQILAISHGNGGIEAELLIPEWLISNDIPTLKAIFIRKVGRFRGHAWEQLDLPRFARGPILNFCNTFPIFRNDQIIVVHDASVYASPDGYTWAFRTYYKGLFKAASLRNSIRIATDSEFSRMELERFAGFNPSRMTVIPCGANHWDNIQPDTGILERLSLTRRPFLLAVGSANKNKNIARLIEAYLKLDRQDVPLVLAGGANSNVFSGVEFKKSDQLIRTGYLSDAELAALYSNAWAFVFPSLYEGFGLPPLEAMHFGCPVVCSREASLPEVAGDAALYCDALDVDDISIRLHEVIENGALRRSLIERGTLQAAKFTWKSSAEKMLQLALAAHPDPGSTLNP